MERFKKKYLLILVLIGIVLLNGCDKVKFGTFSSPDDEDTKQVTIVPDVTQNKRSDSSNTEDITQEPQEISPTVSAQPITVQPITDLELPIYTVNANGELEPVVSLVAQENEITSELIVEKVKESLEDQSITIGIDSVTSDGDAVIVSFIKGEAPDTNMGSEYETAILNAFAQSLLDNLSDHNKVIFRIEGNAYVSGVYEFGIDEPYMVK